MIRDTTALIDKSRALLAHVFTRHGSIEFRPAFDEMPGRYVPTAVMVDTSYIADIAACLVDDEPIDAADVLIAFKAERFACHLFVSGDVEGQDARLLAWDEARERYAQLLAAYCKQTGLTTRKAEKGLGALWVESLGEFAR